MITIKNMMRVACYEVTKQAAAERVKARAHGYAPRKNKRPDGGCKKP